MMDDYRQKDEPHVQQLFTVRIHEEKELRFSHTEGIKSV